MPKHQHGGGQLRIALRQQQRQRRWQDSLRALAEPEADESTVEIDVGRRLRELRTMRGLSIRSLAELSNLNFNTLSLIENEKTSPSVSTLQQLAQALHAPITAFFEAPITHPEVLYQKAGRRPQVAFAHGLIEDMGAGLTLGEGIPLLLSLEPGADSGPDPIVHTGQEFVYCLGGNLSYTVSNEAYELGPGDSLIFQAHLTHRWGNRGKNDTRFILILCPADENDRSAEQHFKAEQGEG
jgi:transcriptional regulator with XRE-family HTH domain